MGRALRVLVMMTVFAMAPASCGAAAQPKPSRAAVKTQVKEKPKTKAKSKARVKTKSKAKAKAVKRPVKLEAVTKAPAPPAQPTATPSGMSGNLLFVILAGLLVTCASMHRIYTKAGHPGWAALTPVYNFVVMADIVGASRWLALAALVPYVGMLAILLLFIKLAKAFNAPAYVGIGAFVLPFVFLPLLAFGKYRYGAATPSGPLAQAALELSATATRLEGKRSA